MTWRNSFKFRRHTSLWSLDQLAGSVLRPTAALHRRPSSSDDVLDCGPRRQLMRRREFITFMGGAALAWPLAARAQQSALPTIGYLSTRSPGEAKYVTDAFAQGLNEIGYVEGRNLAIEYRWAELQYDRLPALASDLVRRQVAVIAAVGGAHSGLAAKAATSTIPIVFVSAGDPVTFGLVASLNRPGANVTGISMITVALAPKRLELLHELVPAPGVIALLVNPTSPYVEPETKDVMASASALGRQVQVLNASTGPEIDTAFATLVQQGVRALLVSGDPFSTASGIDSSCSPRTMRFRGFINGASSHDRRIDELRHQYP
jgi:putative tryptophan/tyrosine transport system substrate-binding protein